MQTLNTTTHRWHRTTIRQTLSKRWVALYGSKAHACLHACSVGTDKFQKCGRDKGSVGRFARWQYRESVRATGKTCQRFGSEMRLHDVQPHESISRVLKSPDILASPICSFPPSWIYAAVNPPLFDRVRWRDIPNTIRL